MRHRPDIDGLRALAVVPVILFHAGVNQVPGGFVGVDIFFVISGYLITSLIVGEMNEGRFSLLTFYERRVRRIVPALAVVLAACMVAAFILYLPRELRSFGESLVATALFVSNIQIYLDLGYFTAPPDTLPLLHTWSLAIEEQFYVVFPLVLMLAFRWGERRWIGLVFGLFLLSLAASIWVTAIDSEAAFLLAPTRVWELMIGALLAAGIWPRIESQALRELASLAGIVLIAYAIFGFSSTTPFPGLAALIPCLGAALVIYAGEGQGTSSVSKALSLRPVVFLGLISYSLYLWHWPLLAFGRYWNITLLTAGQTAGLLLASLALAVLSWAYVEQPFRRKQPRVPRRVIFAGAATAMGIAVAFGMGAMPKGLPWRFSPQVLAIKRTDPDPLNISACQVRSPQDPCIVGAAVRPTYAIWGDSHALAMLPTIADLAARHGKAIKAYVAPGCAALLGADPSGQFLNAGCIPRNNTTIEALESSPEIDTVILISRYAAWLNGPNEPEWLRRRPGMAAPRLSGKSLDPQERSALFERQFNFAVDRLLAAGKTVVLVYPVPEIGFDVPSAVGRVLAGGGNPADLNLPLASFEARVKNLVSILDKAGNGSGHIVRIYPQKRLCNSVQCLIYANGEVFYKDDDHLSRAGINLLLPDFEPIFASDVEAHGTALSASGPNASRQQQP